MSLVTSFYLDSSPLHENDVNEIKILEKERILITVAKDMSVVVLSVYQIWGVPEFWQRSVKGYASEEAKYEHETEYLSASEDEKEDTD